jgi:cytokinin dehydrogenase
MQRIEKMMNPLNFDRSLLFTTDVSYYKFLNRLHDMEMRMRAEGLWEVPHPWVNFLIPRSSMTKFDALALKSLVADAFSGPVLVYPLNRSKYELLCQF